jgi:hypothetical protein
MRMYELIHAHLGHPGIKVMSDFHRHVNGVPPLKTSPLLPCETCLCMKATKRALMEKIC